MWGVVCRVPRHVWAMGDLHSPGHTQIWRGIHTCRWYWTHPPWLRFVHTLCPYSIFSLLWILVEDASKLVYGADVHMHIWHYVGNEVMERCKEVCGYDGHLVVPRDSREWPIGWVKVLGVGDTICPDWRAVEPVPKKIHCSGGEYVAHSGGNVQHPPVVKGCHHSVVLINRVIHFLI